jgi:hypothetical protein
VDDDDVKNEIDKIYTHHHRKKRRWLRAAVKQGLG